VDERGRRVSVLIGIEAYRRLLEELEELEALRACDAAIPFERAIAEIEQSR